MVIASVLGVIAVGGLLMVQKSSAANRVRTQARVILQRNINTALNIPFTSTAVPSILALTTDSGGSTSPENPNIPPPGVRFHEQGIMVGGTQTPALTPILQTPDGEVLLSGTLWRSVKPLTSPNPSGATIRRVTFSITYNIQGREQRLSLTTLRSQDDQ